MAIKSGIYKIEFDECHFYIGSSKNVSVRIYQHINDLFKGKHLNSLVQNKFNEFNGVGMKVTILEICEISVLLEREQYYLDKFLPLLNQSLTARFNDYARGVSLETKKKLSLAAKKRIISQETKNKMSESRKAFMAKNGGNLLMKNLSILSKTNEAKEKMALKLIGNKNAFKNRQVKFD